MEEIIRSLKRLPLRNGKAPGIDNKQAKFFKVGIGKTVVRFTVCQLRSGMIGKGVLLLLKQGNLEVFDN